MNYICVALISWFSLGSLSAIEVTTQPQKGQDWVDLLEKSEKGIGLKHWRMVNVAEGTFQLKVDPRQAGEEVLVCTGKPTGIIRSAEVFENFLVEFEWRHMERNGMRANAGFFVWSDGLPSVGIPFSRSIEVQVANFHKDTASFTRHGDIFPIHGATMTPDPRFAARGQRSLPLEFRTKGTGEWNHYRILCVDGVIQLEVNGKLVSGGYHINPRKGHFMIESEGGEVHFRKMRVLKLASSEGELADSQVSAVLPADCSIKVLYNGLDLNGWKLSDGSQFRAKDHLLVAELGMAELPIVLEGSLILDWSSAQPLSALPVSFGSDRTAMKIAAGRHRLEIDLSSGESRLDGAEVGTLMLSPQLQLHGLGSKGAFSNVLQLRSK